MEPSIFIAFLLGVTSSAHCMFMCGGIMGALALSTPPGTRESTLRLLTHVSAYNLGRTVTYTAAGVLLALFGHALTDVLAPVGGHALLQGLAAVALLAVGFYLLGWLQSLARLEGLGEPLWRRIQPFTRRLLPVRSPGGAFAYGLLWGTLPCGLVYAALIWAAAGSSPAEAALRMLAFAAGTLPSMLAAGVMAGRLTHVLRTRGFRRVAGLTLTVAAVGTAYFSFGAPWGTPWEISH